MREIEIKARVGDRQRLLDRLNKRGIVLSEPITQHDQVYGLPDVPGGDDNESAPWLRIRTETKNGETRKLFTLKRSVTNQLDSIEHETEVADANELTSIIKHLGFTPYSELTKTRQKGHVGDIEICVDTVEKLGDFIELEKLADEAVDYGEIRKELWHTLESFDVSPDDEMTEGYDVMMRKADGLEP